MTWSLINPSGYWRVVFASCGRTTWNVLLLVGHVWPKLLLGSSHSIHSWGCPSPGGKGTPFSVELQCPVNRAHHIGSRVKYQSWLSLSHQPFSSTGVWLQILKCPVPPQAFSPSADQNRTSMGFVCNRNTVRPNLWMKCLRGNPAAPQTDFWKAWLKAYTRTETASKPWLKTDRERQVPRTPY